MSRSYTTMLAIKVALETGPGSIGRWVVTAHCGDMVLLVTASPTRRARGLTSPSWLTSKNASRCRSIPGGCISEGRPSEGLACGCHRPLRPSRQEHPPHPGSRHAMSSDPEVCTDVLAILGYRQLSRFRSCSGGPVGAVRVGCVTIS